MPNTLTKRDEDSTSPSQWEQISDDLLFEIFSRLACSSLLKASQVCRQWHRLSLDEFIWQQLFLKDFSIDKSIDLSPSHTSWRSEYKRLYYHTPRVESEVLKDHRDQVLHVCFSHNGKLFATTSKDGHVKVWTSSYPARVKYYADMREFTWKYTQYSQFNETDTLLLVSGVHFGAHSTSGEIAVFNLVGGFALQSRVLNKPYDIFGTWYNDASLISGNLHWLGHLTSCSVLWLNKASQELQSECHAVVHRLYKFANVNASSIRTIMVAKCPSDTDCESESSPSEVTGGKAEVTMTECCQASLRRDPHAPSQRVQLFCDENRFQLLEVDNEDENAVPGALRATIEYSECYRQAESSLLDKASQLEVSACASQQNKNRQYDGSESPSHSSVGLQVDMGDQQTMKEDDKTVTIATTSEDKNHESSAESSHKEPDKYLLFTTGQKTYTPHQIGIKRIRHKDTCVLTDVPIQPQPIPPPPVVPLDEAGNNIENGHENGMEEVHQDFDELDHIIELHGHIIGMCLSPDQRYLYVNSRTWPQNYEIDDPLYPPPIAQEIDIHVIDLQTMQEVGTMHRAHKAYTPNDECFFLFLDVCNEYVASGAEDGHGYLWDRHYGICLSRFPHTDVVNSVAFNPADPECLITVSDDHLLKIWRSRNRMKELGLHGSPLSP